jgi:Ser/Thr protein kinase RdoA (MazF antagonist)
MHNQSETLIPYLPLVEAALQNYRLGPVHTAFIQHNAGIVFRVTSQETGNQYLLKIHKRFGTGEDPSPEQLEPGLHWLSALAQASDVVVQAPIATNTGSFVGQIMLPSMVQPVRCTLQHWVDGRLPNGDFTEHQVYALGNMMAKIHAFASTYPLADNVSAIRHDTQALHSNINRLRTLLPLSLLSHHDFDILLAAERRIAEYLAELGTHSTVWGPVHGDVHYDNVLIHNQEIRPIDFTGLRLAHYVYDIGVTMYHIFYQGIHLRQMFFAGYQQIYDLPMKYEHFVEACIAYAAIDNIAWNCSIPEQQTAPLFQRNLWDLLNNYCTMVAQGQHFLFSEESI